MAPARARAAAPQARRSPIALVGRSAAASSFRLVVLSAAARLRHRAHARALDARRRGDALVDRRHRPACGGGRSATAIRPAARDDPRRQRAARPGRPAGAARLASGRRDPQLLGARARRQGRHGAGPRQPPAFTADARRRLPRPVRRVLRRAARAMALHVVARGAGRRSTRWLARPGAAGAPTPDDASLQRGRQRVPRPRLRRLPRRARRRRGRRASAPTSRHVGSRLHLGAGVLRNRPGAMARVDRRRAGAEARRAHAVVRRTSTARRSHALAAYLEQPAMSRRRDAALPNRAAAPARRARAPRSGVADADAAGAGSRAVNNTCIGLLYIAHRAAVPAARRRARPADAGAARAARQHAALGRPPTTRSSRCTAR